MEHVVKFADLYEFIEAAENGATDCGEEHRSSKKTGKDRTWDFGTEFDGAIKVARNGWPEGREAIEALTYKFKAVVEDAHREAFGQPVYTRSVAGSGVNVGRYNAGLPDAMVMRKRVEMESPIIDIVCNVSASAAISAQTYMIRGAAVAALTDLLELSGRRVRLTVVVNTAGSGHSVPVYTTIKKPGDPVQMDAIAFATAHPAYLRRLGFSIWEQQPKSVRRSVGIGDGGSGYGTPVDVKTDADLYMPRILSGFDWSESRAQAWVEQQLVNMGVLPKKDEE